LELPHLGHSSPQRVCEYCYKTESLKLKWNTKGVPVLKKGSIMIVMSRFGSKTRLVKLSDDAKQIQIIEAETQQIKEFMPLDTITKISEGKLTPALKNLDAPNDCCFGIIGTGKTFEFQTEKSEVTKSWITFMNTYLDIAKAVDPQELAKQAQSEYQNKHLEEQKKLAEQQKKKQQLEENQAKREALRKKMGY